MPRVDIHTHLLPGVDDGPESMDDTVEMARIASADGTEIILATPHQRDVMIGHSVEMIPGIRVDGVQGHRPSHAVVPVVEALRAVRVVADNGVRPVLPDQPDKLSPEYPIGLGLYVVLHAKNNPRHTLGRAGLGPEPAVRFNDKVLDDLNGVANHDVPLVGRGEDDLRAVG